MEFYFLFVEVQIEMIEFLEMHILMPGTFIFYNHFQYNGKSSFPLNQYVWMHMKFEIIDVAVETHA